MKITRLSKMLAGIATVVIVSIVFYECPFGKAQEGIMPPVPDYSTDSAWLAKTESIESPVDVFYVYPTIYAGTNPKNMDISDLELRANAAGLLVAQASVYSKHANLFAPFYRQQSGATQSMIAGNDGKDPFQDTSFQAGARDIEQAFEY